MLYGYINKFCFAHQDRKVHLTSHLHSFCIVDQTSIYCSFARQRELNACMLIRNIICTNRKRLRISGDVLPEILDFSLLFTCLVFSLIIGKCSIYKSYGNFDILIRNVIRLKTYILYSSCLNGIFYSFFTFSITKIYLYLR